MVFGVSGWCSVRRDFGDGGVGGGFIHDGFVGGEGGDEGLQGEVVDRARVAAAGLVDNPTASSENSVSSRPASARWWRR